MKSQLRFAKLNSKHEKKKNIPFSDISLSSEMTSWLDQTFTATDDDGYLPEMVGSALTQPLDSFAAFCPTGNLLKSKFTSSRIPTTREVDDDDYYHSSKLMTSTSDSVGSNKNEKKIIDFDSTVNRLNVMWLQRKAKLEEEDGDLNSSYKTMQQAIDLHIGPQPYEKAGMSEPVQASNPLDLMIEIEKNYFPYDATSHRIADKLQRWYHRFYSKKTSAASIVQKKYRKYLRIRKAWRDLQVQIQCSKLIQRRFRTHLKRMHRLATKLKAWYRMRVKMREYNFLIRFYRAARFIQRLTRGMWGRKIAARKRLERFSAMRIQRNTRGYICRKRRAWALSQYHKIFFYAALKIQCFFRRMLSISRCQRRLLEEIIREEVRMEKERGIRDETIQLELSRTRIYLRSAAGKLHFEACKKRILAQDDEFDRMKPTLSQQEVLAHDASIIFEIYDADGSGTIDSEELKLMLIDLCVPVDDTELVRLVHQLDEDGSGDIDFEEFIDWYSNGGGEGSTSVSGMMFKQLLKARRIVLDLSGETLRRRAERAVLRQCCSWLSNETKSMFRMTQPPKYNCCRCLEPFVLFTDYLRHFKGSGDNRVCCVTGERALFYPKFWVQNDWLKQRQCESEVMRVTYEYPCLTYKAMMAVYSELAILSNPELSFLLSSQISAASDMYKPLLEFSEDPQKFYTKNLCDHIFEIVNLCNDGFLSPNIAHCVSRCLGEELPNDWVVNDRWKLDLFYKWLSNLSILTRPLPPPKYPCISCCQSASKVRDQDSYLLGDIFVRCVRLLLVGAETSLISLAEYRLKRPRRITITDGELKKNKLQLLTRESYDTVRVKLIKRLRIIRDTLRKLQICAINYHKLNANKTVLSKLNRYLRQKFGLSYSQIDVVTDDPSEEEIDTYEIESAHVRAKAHYQYRLKSRIGKAHLRRAKFELWAKKRQIYQDANKLAGRNNSQAQLIAYIDYLMNIFTIPEYHPDEIHHRDLDLIFRNYLYIDIPASENPVVQQLLDPNNTGYITKENLCNWLLTGGHLQYLSFKEKLQHIDIPFVGVKDAKLKILCDMRRITRNEIDSQKQALRVIDALLEAEENPNQKRKLVNSKIKMLQEESEASNEKLKHLKLTFDKQEQRVLSRISEDDAENMAKRKMILSREGRYFLSMETLLMKIATEVIHSYGEIIPSIAHLPSSRSPVVENEQAFTQCLSILINCFDTDCSGTFDESEITLLLKCVKCSLPEKWILFHFPDVIVDSSSLAQVVAHLLTRVRWSRTFLSHFKLFKDIQISTKSLFVSSSLLLISSARQSAREKSDQAAELVNTGVLLDNDDSSESGKIAVTEGLLVRCQLLAMRQTSEFLTTPFGHIRKLTIQQEMLKLWEQVVIDGFSKLSLVRYIFSVFQIDGSGTTPYPFRLLNSELPHIVRFAAIRFNWALKPNTCQTLSTLYKFTEESDARWIMFDELVNVIDSVFDSSTQKIPNHFLPRYALSDSQKRMESIARQQAILIAINYPDKNVKETNYRCFILGMLRSLEMLKSSDLDSTGAIDWENIPFEGMLLYLLAQGFTYNDLISKCQFYQSDDIIDYDHLVNPDEVLSSAMNEIFSQLNCTSSVYRIGRYLVGFQYFHLYSKVVRLMLYHQNEINIFGRMFLNEIITGVSHCTFEN